MTSEPSPGRMELLEKLIHCCICAEDLRSDPFLKEGELINEAMAVDSESPSPEIKETELIHIQKDQWHFL